MQSIISIQRNINTEVYLHLIQMLEFPRTGGIMEMYLNYISCKKNIIGRQKATSRSQVNSNGATQLVN